MEQIIQFVNENKEQLLIVLGSLVATASAICALTPTPKKGTLLSKLYKLIEWAALNIGKAKQTGDSTKDNN